MLCATNTEDTIFFARWTEPGMHIGSIKRPEVEMDAMGKADRVAIHTRDVKPITEVSKVLADEQPSVSGNRPPRRRRRDEV